MSVNCGCKALLWHYEYSKWFKGSKYRNGNEASLPNEAYCMLCLVLVQFLVYHLANIYAFGIESMVDSCLPSGLSMCMRATKHSLCVCSLSRKMKIESGCTNSPYYSDRRRIKENHLRLYSYECKCQWMNECKSTDIIGNLIYKYTQI